jgi:hypothetical protein
MNPRAADISSGARNMLLNCAGLLRGDSILLVYENPKSGWWDAELVGAISSTASGLGIEVKLLETGVPTNSKDAVVNREMENYDCTIFLARMGDQDRFGSATPGKKIVMCYARDTEMMASAFGVTEYQAMYQLKVAIDILVSEAELIDISCPRGTRYSGSIAQQAPSSDSEVSIFRFPLGVISPIDASNFSGQVVVADYLTPTGSAVYEPAWLKLQQPVTAHVDFGRISHFEGSVEQVKLVEQHYQSVADRLAIDAYVVDSWHVGMHQGLSYQQKAEVNPDRWSNTVFNHPRFMHFHTCGNYAPGEICWLVFNQSIVIDGMDLWRNGQLCLDNFDLTRDCLQRWPQLRKLFSQASGLTGLAS